MSCAHPLTAFLDAGGGLHFSERAGRDIVRTVFLGCGRCALCRAAKSADLRTRLVHESCMHGVTCVPTLTYADEHLPLAGSVSKRDVQLFLKRARSDCFERGRPPFRYHVLAEYSPGMRPHYHAILFGYWPDDAIPHGKSRSGNPQFTSETLTRLWGKGHVTFQYFTPGAASYIAGHDAHKLTRTCARQAVAIHDAHGLVGFREAEFRLASRRPGIGASFFDRHGEQMLANGFTVVGGRKAPVSRYYLERGKRQFPALVSDLKADRALLARGRAANETRERLAVREDCALEAAKRSMRNGVDS